MRPHVRSRSSLAVSRSEMPIVTARTSRLSLSIMRSTSRTSVASKRMGPAGMRRQYRPSDRPSDARTARRLTFQGAAQVTVRMPPVPVVHWLPQVTLARQAHDGVEPQPPGSAGQAYDGGLPAGTADRHLAVRGRDGAERTAAR